MDAKFAALIPVVCAVVEAAARLGLKRKFAHLLALPLGPALCFLVMRDKTVAERILYGIIIGLGSIGTCETCRNGTRALFARKKASGPAKKKRPDSDGKTR